MVSNPRIKAHSFDDLLCIQVFHFCICIKLIKVRNSQRKIGISKQFYSFCFCIPHEQCIDIFFYRSFFQQLCKLFCCLNKTPVCQICPDNDPAWVKVIIQCPGFPQKFRTENDILASTFLPDTFCKSNRYC